MLKESFNKINKWQKQQVDKMAYKQKDLPSIHDNKGQGSALRSKDLQQESNPLWYHLFVFRPFKTQLD